jgi:DNA replication and repair protein RecF
MIIFLISYFCSKGMTLELLKFILTNFKNYEYEQVTCSPGLNCFLGKNGMGKTNLLDAIYYLCMSKSHFNLPDSSIVRHNTDFFRLEGHFIANDKREEIVAKVMPRKKKVLERNKVPYQKLSEHIGLLPVVMIAPDDTYLVMEGSEARRKFIDNTLSQLDTQYLSALIKYNKLLQQRNSLLKQFGEQNYFDPTLLSAYSSQMVAPGQMIFEKRLALCSKLEPLVQNLYEKICNGQESVSLSYQSKLKEQQLSELFEQQVEKDRIMQRTTAGPHKDELSFRIGDFAMKRFASQGQLKSFVLALKLAQYQLLKVEKNMLPILLLDDIFDKLDDSRVSQLLGLLVKEEYGQIFVTDTDEERIQTILKQYKQAFLRYRVDHGQIEAID